jgi:5'-nucleotidase
MALDMLGYDAIALGNHDFDFGPDTLAAFIAEGFKKPGSPPYLSANLDFSGEPALQALVDEGVIAGSIIVKEKGQEIGIIGAVTPALPTISSPRNVIVDPDVAAVVQAEVDDLEALGVNKIVLISHLQDIDGDILLASMLDGVDVMVAGGGDELLANPGDLLLPGDTPGDIFGPYPMVATDVDGTLVPVVTTSGSYGYLGDLEVDFDAAGNVTGWGGGPIRVVGETFPDGVKSDTRMQKKVADPVAIFLDLLASTVIGTSEVDLDGLRSSVRSVEANEGNLIADALRWQATQLAAEFGVPVPDVALQNGGGIRNDDIIPAGTISELDTFSMVPFPNFLTVFPAVPRAQFKEILENAVSRISPPAAPGGSGRFAQISGFSFTYDTTGTPMLIDQGTNAVLVPGSRVMEVTLDDGTVIVTGGAVVTGPDLTVATIDFLARGGDQYPYRGAPFTVLGASYQQALSNYIVDGLGGVISAADYPVGGEGRITQLP